VDVAGVGGVSLLLLSLCCSGDGGGEGGGGCDWGGWWFVVGGGGCCMLIERPVISVLLFHHQIEIKLICNHFSAILLFETKQSNSALANTLRRVVRVLNRHIHLIRVVGGVYLFFMSPRN
jgi:hypothetical protein